jgi:hypothetical protein
MFGDENEEKAKILLDRAYVELFEGNNNAFVLVHSCSCYNTTGNLRRRGCPLGTVRKTSYFVSTIAILNTVS